MAIYARVLVAAVLVSALMPAAQSAAADAAPTPLIPLAATWTFMGNGGPQVLPGTCEVGIDSHQPADGSTPYTVRCANAQLPSFGGARTRLDVVPYRGKRIRVSAELMTADVGSVPNAQYPDVAGEGGLWIGLATPRDGMRTNRMADRTIKGTTGWETRDFVVDVPQDANLLQAGFWLQGRGQLWMRNLKVEEVPTSVAVNFDRNAPNTDSAVDMSLTSAAAPRPGEMFLPPPRKWLALGESGFELCDAGVDAKMLAAGQRNLSIACSIPKRLALRQAFDARPFWGKRVRFSAWVKTQNVQSDAAAGGRPGATFYLAATDTNGPTYFDSITGTTDWTRHELVIDIPAGASHIPAGVSLNGTGQVWARDLKFEVVSADTPVTPLPVAAR